MITNDKLSDDLTILDAWLLASVETAEICSKVLDWKIKNSSIGEQVSQSYILYVEEVLFKIEQILRYEDCTELKIRANDYKRKIQNLMFEIYKRLMDE